MEVSKLTANGTGRRLGGGHRVGLVLFIWCVSTMALWMGSVLLLLTHIIVAAAITPISIKGTKFFDDEGQQFFVKGEIRDRHYLELELTEDQV